MEATVPVKMGRMLAQARRLAAPALALGLAACAAVAPREETAAEARERRTAAPRPAYNLAGYPQAVREGYIDGCESARRSPYAHRDEKRMAADPQYRMGWNDGHAMCRGR